MIWASLDPLLERPYGAIPLYLLMGLAAARAGRRDHATSPWPADISPATDE
jgi:hypothetical protein